MQRDYELKAEYIDGGVTINVKHPGGEYVKKFDYIRQELFNKFIVQTNHTQSGYDETKYRLYWETEHGFKLLLVIFDIENLATDTIEESFIKVYFTNNNIAIETNLIPHTSSPTTNPTEEPQVKKDYEINAEYICDNITISVKNNGGEYIETINNIREYTSLYNIEYIQPENGFEERKYNVIRDTKHGFRFVIKIHDLVSKETGSISKSYLKVDLITDDYQKITTPFIPRKEPQMSENQDKHHDGNSFVVDENFQEEPIGPDTGPNGDLASLEAKINELTELVLNQHRVITHMGNKMSILHGDLMRLISHYHPTTPGFYPPHQPPATPVYPPQQPPAGYYLSDANVYPARFNPQQPAMGNCAGMGQGLCRNPVPQQSSPTTGHMADHLTYWGNFANQNYSMGNMVNMGSNSVLDQMNGLNQRVKAQQQPTATKEEIKDQAMFWSNFLK